MRDSKAPVDFANPEAIEAELIAAQVAVGTAAPKEKKEPKPRVIKVSFVADKDIVAGETVTFDYEIPKGDSIRGIVAGIALVDMTDDQLKIEYRNANSVHYKTVKAGKSDPSKSAARLDACKAEMEKRGIQPSARAAVPMDAAGVAALITTGKINIADLQALLDAATAAVTE